MLKNSITFLGTGGGRVVVFRQIRHSGGIWLNLEGTNVLIDPGPGSLVRIFEKGFDTRDIDIIVVSHRHLDHSADLNSVIESASESTKKPKDLLIAPLDVVEGDDPILLKYLRKAIKEYVPVEENKTIPYKNIQIIGTIKHIHEGADTYGLEFHSENKKVIYVPCGKFYEKMLEGYSENADVMIFNTTFPKKVEGYYHLSAEDVEKMIERYKPKIAVITHFSVAMLKADPEKIAARMSRKTGVKVLAAYDGMRLNF
ncbi:Ribonuclease BN, tRNA processing enzyme [Persephonella hydrogeniphila]|uniref:Ribonuclease BN, tRNA processing enzyme n=1 Tax=Persephonella hydrogeniphila TaxID=198703 RepID=A0A285MYZ9_9AQUI|nr:MBL fold metallo-hydrolase [Persephonella hydrogeniphila]SNZ02412.1 Ribonuclease BN, tRNA processing enzyme [Persephonella hydrogeniphila]